MRSRMLQTDGRRTYVLALDEGEEVVETLTRFASANALTAARFTAIGALSRVKVGFWRPEAQTYKEIPIDDQVEVLALTGFVTRGADADVKLHAHVVVGTSEGLARGGHLLEARVRPTLEVVLVDEPVELRRRHDDRTGLALLDMPA